MYFYKLMSGDYESSNETTYYSDKKYTQEEFEDIVFDLFEECCKQLIEQEPESICYPNIHFTFEDVFWDYQDNFKKKMAEKGFYELNKKLTGYMFFDMTSDNFYTKIYKDIDDSYEKRANVILDNIDIDESCWDNNCPILGSDEEEKYYARHDCLVRYRKGKQIVNKSCDNCLQPYMSCDKENHICKDWVWKGDD